MSNGSYRAGSFATASAALLVAVMTGMGVGLSDPAPIIERGFHEALAEARSDVQSSTQQVASVPEAGSEAYWLSQRYAGTDAAGQLEPVVWTTPVTTGEKIVISTGTNQRTLEVVSVEEIAPNATRLDMANTSDRRFVVTCRDTAAGEDRLLRFEIVAEAPGRARTTTPARAL